MFEVSLYGLEFYAYHGVPAEERVVGHRYSVDLELVVHGKADLTDNVSDTVDYGLLARFIQDQAQRTQVQTLERLTRLLAEGVLREYSQIHNVRITVSKLLPPAPVVLERASVTIEVGR
jgi:dihydroneopterin aldolase